MKIKLFIIVLVLFSLISCGTEDIVSNNNSEDYQSEIEEKTNIQENNLYEKSNAEEEISEQAELSENMDNINEKYRIIADTLNVRSMPSINSQIVSQLYENEEVTVIDTTTDSEQQVWLKVEYNSVTGWIAGWYARPVLYDSDIGLHILIDESSEVNSKKSMIVFNDMEFNDESSYDVSLAVQNTQKSSERIDIILEPKNNVNYDFISELKTKGAKEILVPVVLDDSKVLFLVKDDDNENFSLCRQDIFTGKIDVVYKVHSDDTENLGVRCKIKNVYDDLVILSIDNDLVIYNIYLNEVINHIRFAEDKQFRSYSTSVSPNGMQITYVYKNQVVLSNLDFSENKIIAHGSDLVTSENDGIIPGGSSFNYSNSDKIAIKAMGWESLEEVFLYDISTGKYNLINIHKNSDNYSNWITDAYYSSKQYDGLEHETGIFLGVTDMNNTFHEFTDKLYGYSDVFTRGNNYIFATNEKDDILLLNVKILESTNISGINIDEEIVSISKSGSIIITYNEKYKVYLLDSISR